MFEIGCDGVGCSPCSIDHGASYDPHELSDESLPWRFSVSTASVPPSLCFSRYLLIDLSSGCSLFSVSPRPPPLWFVLFSGRLLPLVFRLVPTVIKFVHRLISSLSQSPLGVLWPVASTHGPFYAYKHTYDVDSLFAPLSLSLFRSNLLHGL